MRKKILILAIVNIFLTAIPLRANNTIVFSAVNDFPALVAVNQALISEAYKQIGFKIIVKELPAARALQMSNRGKTDGELFRIAGINKEYPNLIMIPVSVYDFEGIIFSKNKDIIINGWESLKPLKIGVMRGIVFSDSPTRNMNRYVCSEVESLFGLLYKERVDVVAFTELDGLIFLSKHFTDSGIKALKPPVVKLPLYNYLHKKHENLVPEITSVLKEMKENGTIQEIIDKTESKLLGK